MPKKRDIMFCGGLIAYIALTITLGGFFHTYFGSDVTWIKGCFIGFIIGGGVYFGLANPVADMLATFRRTQETKSRIRKLEVLSNRVKEAKNGTDLEKLQAEFDVKYLLTQRRLEKEFIPDFYSMFYINIWDEYDQQGRTFAYLEENDVPDQFAHAVLKWLQPIIQSLLNNNIIVSVDFFDGSRVYSKLLGSAGEWSIYKRWQLGFSSLPDETRLMLVSRLNAMQLSFDDVPLKFISES